MAGRGYFSNFIPPNGAIFSDYLSRFGSPHWTQSGEIAHWNEYYPDPGAVAFPAFRNSPPHWAVIIDCRLNSVGVGVYRLGPKYFFVADYLRE